MKEYYCDEFENSIKVIAFDFDETFYSSDNMRELYLEYIKRTFMQLCGFSEEKTKLVMESLGYTPTSKIAPSFSHICKDFGVSEETYHTYRIKNNFEIDYSNAEIVENKTLEKFAEKFHLYIVSNEIDKILYSKFKKIGLNENLFSGVYATPIDANKTNTKDVPYLDIIKREKIKPNELLAIGDRFKVDIEPALKIGASGILINKPRDLKFIIENILN